MAQVLRYDAGILHKAEPTPQGGVRVPAYLTRTGVFTYRTADGGVRRELRTPEEVFQGDSLRSLAGAPVTDLHPERDGVKIPVTSANWRELAVGHVAEDSHREDPGHVAATLLIQDQPTIDRINAGQRKELSCGYSCTLDPTAGVWEPTGEVYDAIQRGIVYNHVAIGPEGWGRAGPSVALRLDSEDAIQIDPGKDQTVKETIGGVEYTVGSPEHKAAKAAQVRADSAEAKVKELEASLAKVQDPKTFQAAVQRRAGLVVDCQMVARRFPGVTFDAAGAAAMPESDLIAQAITTLDPAFDVKGKTPEALAAVFEYMVGQMKAAMGAEGAEADKMDRTLKPGENDTQKAADAPPAPVVPKQDGDRPRSVFSARQGVLPPAGTTPVTDSDKDRQDSDAARAGMVNGYATRSTKPLAFTKRPAVQ